MDSPVRFPLPALSPPLLMEVTGSRKQAKAGWEGGAAPTGLQSLSVRSVRADSRPGW